MASERCTHVDIRMYRMGTGDCFVLKYFSGDELLLTMMIDAGVWSGKKTHLQKYVRALKKYVNNKIDVLVITHEHKDHVYAFQSCKDLFTKDFEVDEVWMGWSEEDGDPKVEKWKKKYGEKKKALALAAQQLESRVREPAFKRQFDGHRFSDHMLSLRKNQAAVVQDFADLNTDYQPRQGVRKVYKGHMEGLRVVKEDMNVDGYNYLRPGQIFKHDKLPGITFHSLGPPEIYKDIALEHGGEGESYDHSHNLEAQGAFADAIGFLADQDSPSAPEPFEQKFKLGTPKSEEERNVIDSYDSNPWRQIEYDWLYSAGSLALRMNGLTNNLSLALAIRHDDTKEVLLFPGDAEYGSWASWHAIDWGNAQDPHRKHLTEELLNNTIFYKVAHHMSHNGTARRLGLEMMKHPRLTAMATLDYEVISNGWKNTMPNKFILDELLHKTKGRVIFNNLNNIPYEGETNLESKIKKVRTKMDSKEKTSWKNNFKTDTDKGLWHQYTVRFEM